MEPTRLRIFTRYNEIVTEQSAANGEADRTEMRPPLTYAIHEEKEDGETDEQTAVRIAVQALKREGTTYPSSSQFYPGVWYSGEAVQDYKTGEYTTTSYHLVMFTEQERRLIYDAITAKN